MRRIIALAAAAVAGVAAPVAEARTHYIFTVAGGGASGFDGDGGPATRAALDLPRGLAWAPRGGFLVAEANNNVVRQVSSKGTIRTVAGDGGKAYGGDGGRAVAAQLDYVHDVALLEDGGFLVADMNNRRIRKVDERGRIRTVAGNGNPGPDGDGGRATRAELNYPHAVAPLPGGGFLIADSRNDTVRRVLRSGKIVTVAGNGTPGYGGDDGPATIAQLDNPFDVAPLEDGGFLIADTGNDVIRKVSRSGRITTVAGVGVGGFSGDGGPATGAQLSAPHSVAVLDEGGYVVADTLNDRIRRVRRGVITTVAGDGAAGFGGDGGRATRARLNSPKAVAATRGGGFLVADSENDRVRFVSVVGARPLSVGLGSGRRGRRSLRVRYDWNPLSALDGGRTRLAFRSAVRARVRIELLARGRRAAALRVRARAGRNLVELPETLGPGRYRVELVARTVDGQRSVARGRLAVVAPSLPARATEADGGERINPAALVLGAVGALFTVAGGLVMAHHRRLVRRERERRARRAQARPWLD